MNKWKKRERSKHNLLQNIWYVIHITWEVRKSVLVLCVLTAVLTVANTTTELLVVPGILSRIEHAASIQELLLTIAGFTFALLTLAFLKSYVDTNQIFGQIEVLGGLIRRVGYKAGTMSYPLKEDADINKKQDKAIDAIYHGSREIWNNLTSLLINLLGFIVYLGMLTSLKPLLLGVILLTAIVGYWLNRYMNEWHFRRREEQARYTRKLRYSGSVAEKTEYAKDIRLFGMREWLNDVYDRTLALYEAFIMKMQLVYLFGNVVDAVMTILRNGIAYIYLIGMTLRGEVTASEFLLYFSAVTGFTTWITGILNSLTELKRNSVEITTLVEYMDTPEIFRFEDGKSLPFSEIESLEIRLQDVSFRYPNAEKYILSHVNLTLHPGERLAIVGLNGAGKTTLVKLICGFYDPTEGEVLLNGQDIRQYNRREYYALFSAVFQDFLLLPTSVADNVAQHSVCEEDRVRVCLDKAGLLEKVESLSGGIYHHVGNRVYADGVNFSGGELQRLMLARALYKESKVLVLDEPTAALDAIAERDMYMKYQEMTEGKSSVYISHRLASTRFCDRIILIADGRIAEEGTHESLMDANGKYAELFQVQSKYYREGEAQDENDD